MSAILPASPGLPGPESSMFQGPESSMYQDMAEYESVGRVLQENEALIGEMKSDFAFKEVGSEKLLGEDAQNGLQWIQDQVKVLKDIKKPTIQEERTLDFLVELAPKNLRENGFMKGAEGYKDSVKKGINNEISNMYLSLQSIKEVNHLHSCNCRRPREI